MPFHLAGYWAKVDNAGAFVDMAALADQRLQTNVNNIRVPALNNIVLAAVGSENAVAARARLYSPSIEEYARYELKPHNQASAAAVIPESPPKLVDLRRVPLVLKPDENLRFELNSNPAAVREQWCMVWFSDQGITPVEGAGIYTCRLTGTTTVVAGAWSDCVLTIDDELPVGTYSVVGMRFESATAIAGRLNFIGTDQNWRPGVLGYASEAGNDSRIFRHGQMGEFGRFQTTSLPHLEALCNAADTAQTVILDVVKVG